MPGETYVDVDGWQRQFDVLNSTAPIRLFLGGIGTGKTYTGGLVGLHEWLPAGGTYMAVEPSYPTARDVLVPTCQTLWAAFEPDFHRGDMLFRFRRSDALVLIRSADNPDSLRGPSVTAAWIDELGLCPGGSGGTLDVVLGRLREGGKLGRLLVTTTPKQARTKGLKREDIKALVGSHGVDTIRAETWQNPFIDAEYYRFLRSRYTGLLAQQELKGEFVSLGAGMVDPDWFIEVDAAPGDVVWYRYFDLAFSLKIRADRTATICCGISPSNGLTYFAYGWAERYSIGDLPGKIGETIQRDGRSVAQTGIETNGMGSQVWTDVQAELRSVTVRGIDVDRDKLTRFLPVISRAERGLVRFVRGPWVADCKDELAQFPDGEHDDWPDALSGSYTMAASMPAADYSAQPAIPRRARDELSAMRM